MIRSILIALVSIGLFAQDKPSTPVAPPPTKSTLSINNAERVALTSLVEKSTEASQRINKERETLQNIDKMYQEVKIDICKRLVGSPECEIKQDGTVELVKKVDKPATDKPTADKSADKSATKPAAK